MAIVRLATSWLDGCSGCHMSLLDMDQRLLEIADRIELVYSPLVDAKDLPAEVDVALLEGAVGSEADLRLARTLRHRARILVALGDCAVTGNVPAMRNVFPVAAVLQRAYRENASHAAGEPRQAPVPPLQPQAGPLHAFVAVDAFLPGCPPPAEAILYLLLELLAGRLPNMVAHSRFGA